MQVSIFSSQGMEFSLVPPAAVSSAAGNYWIVCSIQAALIHSEGRRVEEDPARGADYFLRTLAARHLGEEVAAPAACGITVAMEPNSNNKEALVIWSSACVS